jgi:hypothetical protein
MRHGAWRRVVWAVAAVALGAGEPALARVVVEPPVQDFGTVEQGTRVTRGFVLQNKSRQAVRIDRVLPSCACTVAAPEGQIIGRGGRTVVTVTLDTAELVGRTTKSIGVRTSDPQTPLVQLWLRGVVYADLMVAPTAVYLGRVFRTQPVRRELVISPGRPGGTTFTVSSVETESPALRTYLVPGAKPGQQKVIIELTGDAPSGRFNDEVTIRTTSPRQPVIKVPVFGQILG